MSWGVKSSALLTAAFSLLSFQDTLSQKSVDIHDSVQPRPADGRSYQPSTGPAAAEELSKARPTASECSLVVWQSRGGRQRSDTFGYSRSCNCTSVMGRKLDRILAGPDLSLWFSCCLAGVTQGKS